MKLPNFLCIGAPKSGTTTLYNVMKQHDDIFLPSFKEPHFFDIQESWEKGIEWYCDSYYSKASHLLVGDFTPTYLANPHASGRMFDLLGSNVKFIVILREPLSRAYSHFLHTQRDQYESLSFEKALDSESERLKEFNNEASIIKYGYQYHSRYAEHLKRYFKLFKRDQFFIITFNEYIMNQEQVTKDIFKFLGLSIQNNIKYDLQSNTSSQARSVRLKSLLKESSVLKSFAKALIPSSLLRQKIRNKIQSFNNRPTEKAPLPESLKRNCYQRYFKHEVEELEELLSINLSHWKYD